MYPWLFFWAPELHLPFGGSVAQRIEPSASWFFDSIPPAAGDARIEKEAFDIASYGRQLGLITEVLIGLADKVAPDSEEARDALVRLRTIKNRIDGLKDDDAAALVLQIEERLARLHRIHASRVPELRKHLLRSLAEDDDS